MTTFWGDAMRVMDDTDHLRVLDSVSLCVRQAKEIARLRAEVERLTTLLADVRSVERELDEKAAEVEALRGTLLELRMRYHAAGRRPEECYEMSIIDAAIRREYGLEVL